MSFVRDDNDKITTKRSTHTKTHNEGKRLENFFVLFTEICDIR